MQDRERKLYLPSFCSRQPHTADLSIHTLAILINNCCYAYPAPICTVPSAADQVSAHPIAPLALYAVCVS